MTRVVNHLDCPLIYILSVENWSAYVIVDMSNVFVLGYYLPYCNIWQQKGLFHNIFDTSFHRRDTTPFRWRHGGYRSCHVTLNDLFTLELSSLFGKFLSAFVLVYGFCQRLGVVYHRFIWLSMLSEALHISYFFLTVRLVFLKLKSHIPDFYCRRR